MTENNFIILSLAYLIVAGMLTFWFGPLLINKGNDIVNDIVTYKNINSLSIQLEKKLNKPKIVLNGKEYDSIPLSSSIKLKNNVKEYLDFKIFSDTLLVSNTFNTKSTDFQIVTDFLKKNNILKESDLKDETLLKIKNVDVNFIKEVEVRKSQIRSDKNNIAYLKVNNHTLKGGNIKLRAWTMILAGYFVTILSGIGLLLIPVSMYTQIRDYKDSGTKMHIPNKLEGIKQVFNLFTRKNKKNKKNK
ncbi:hypothetical protein ABW636_20035 [Aquimarina sp. 2201CG1-2-11]|uniref:hypothetical protein n=1 Tax=Aquimarina discodermiae TaxID=3231043 RepID=UPI00346305EE